MDSTVRDQGRTSTSSPVLEIIAGLHRGVSLVLDKDEYRIGGAPGADIVLRDAGLEPDHAVLRIDRKGARVEATGGDVSFDGGVLAKGHGCQMRFPMELSFGAARIRITGPESAGKGGVLEALRSAGGFISGRPFIFAAAVLGCASVALLLARGVPRENGASSSLRPGPHVTGDGKTREKPETTAAMASDALQQIKDRLNAAGITTLKASVVDGRISVSGALGNREAAAWMAIQQWFDETYAGRLVLTAHVAIGDGPGSPALALRLQAVWLGDHPYILTEEGARHDQGSLLDNGWRLSEVRENQIVFSRGSETYTLSYR